MSSLSCAATPAGPRVAPRTASTPAEAPGTVASSEAPPPLPVTEEDAILREVAAVRHLDPLGPVPVTYLDEASFRARAARTTVPPSRATVAMAIAFGFVSAEPRAPVPPDPGDGLAVGFLGFFDFDSHALYVRQGLPETALTGVLVHEMSHALQDQHFGMETDEEDEDVALAHKALYEGDAMVVREAFAASRAHVPLRPFLDRSVDLVRSVPPASLARALGAPPELFRASRLRRAEMLFAYLAGLAFVDALHQEGGFAAVDGAFRRLPTSTQQVLHPSKYLANDSPVPVEAPPPPPGYHAVTEGTLGEARTRIVLTSCDPAAVDVPPLASPLGAGWAGDRYLVAEGPAGSLALLWRTTWETTDDAIRFERALRGASRCWPSRGSSPGWHIGRQGSITRDGAQVSYVRGVT